MRRELDLYANVRPVTVPEEGIDWIFYRENTEGEYALGSKGIEVPGVLAMDFKVTTDCGTQRIARAAFEYARKNGKTNVAIVTKANIMKKTDGKFSKTLPRSRRRLPGDHRRGLVHRHHDRQPDKERAAETSSRYSCCLTCTATSSPTRPPRSRAA